MAELKVLQKFTVFLSLVLWFALPVPGQAATSVAGLLEQLGSGDLAGQRVVVKALDALDGAEVVDDLLKALGHRHWLVRGCAAAALGRFSDQRIAPALIKALADPQEYVRLGAATALGHQRKSVVSIAPLVKALEDQSWLVQAAAATSLVVIGKLAFPALVTTLLQKDWETRRKAADILEELHWQPGNDQESVCFFMAQRAYDKVASLGSPAVPILLAELDTVPRDVWNEVAECLKKMAVDDFDITAILTEIGNGDYRALGRLGFALILLRPRFPRVAAMLKRVWPAMAGNFIFYLIALFPVLILYHCLFYARYLPFKKLTGFQIALSGSLLFLLTASIIAFLFLPLSLGFLSLICLTDFEAVYLVAALFGVIVTISVSLLILPVWALVLAPLPGFSWPWRRAVRMAPASICPECRRRRFVFGDGLPLVVRLTNRRLARELEIKYDDFLDYFKCSNCSGNRKMTGVKELVGVIGGGPETLERNRRNGEQVQISIWNHTEGVARYADVDVIEIRKHPGIRYDMAIEALWITLNNQSGRPAEFWKKVSVRIKGKPKIAPGVMNFLKHNFGPVTSI